MYEEDACALFMGVVVPLLTELMSVSLEAKVRASGSFCPAVVVILGHQLLSSG